MPERARQDWAHSMHTMQMGLGTAGAHCAGVPLVYVGMPSQLACLHALNAHTLPPAVRIAQSMRACLRSGAARPRMPLVVPTPHTQSDPAAVSPPAALSLQLGIRHHL